MADHFPMRLELFGGPVLLRGTESVAMSPNQVALLTLLLAEGRERLPRGHVQGLLWRPSSDARVRHRLSQLIYQLNQRLTQRLAEIEGEAVRVYQGVVSCDLDDFEELIRRPDFRAAGELTRRGFLSAFPTPPTEAFEDWMRRRRLAIRSRLREKALGSWAAAEAKQDWVLGRSAAEALLLLDPRDEAILRRVMKARAMGGMVREAEAVYLGFADRRGDRGEWVPQPETLQLLESVRATFQNVEPPPDVAVPAGLEVPLCGRDEEMAYLTRSVFQDRPDGRRATVVINGEAGLGKTRLVEEAIQGARFRGYRVLRSRPAELERNIPLNPLLEALNQPWVGRVLRGLDDPWRSVLLSLMPQFHEGPGPLPEVPYVQPVSLPRRTYEAFLRLFRAVAEESRVLLFIDDFHWADESSAAVLQFMHRRWQRGGLTLLLTYRQEELERDELLHRFLRELEADPLVVSICLEELREGPSLELAGSVASERLSDGELTEVVSLAGGNPFFLIELTADYVTDRTPERRGDGVPLPTSIRQVISRRTRELDPVAKQVVAALAVLARPASLGRLTRVTGCAREECVEALERLQDVRLVEWSDGGVSCRRDIVRRAVYEDLSEARRAFLHGKIAEMIRTEPGDPPKDQLALHFFRAGEAELALRYALEAADEAEVSGSNSAGIRYTSMAIGLTQNSDQKAALHRRMARLHHLNRDLVEAETWLARAVEDAQAQPRLGSSIELESQLVEVRAETGSIRAPDALQRLLRLEQESREQGCNDVLLQIMERQLRILDRLGRLAEICDLLEKVEVYLGDVPPRSECALHCMLAIKLFFGDARAALEHGRMAVGLVREHGLDELRLRAYNRHIMLLSQSGRLHGDEGERIVAEALAGSKHSGDVLERYLIRANIGVWYLDTGQLDRARFHFLEIGKEVAKSKARRPRFELAVNLGELALQESDFGTALTRFSEAREMLSERTPFYARSFANAGFGLSLLRLGRLREAFGLREDIDEPPTVWHSDQVLWVHYLCEVEAKKGTWESADELVRVHEQAILERLPVLWLKLRLVRIRMLRRSPMSSPTAGLAEEGRDLAIRLGLRVRAEEFGRLFAGH